MFIFICCDLSASCCIVDSIPVIILSIQIVEFSIKRHEELFGTRKKKK